MHKGRLPGGIHGGRVGIHKGLSLHSRVVHGSGAGLIKVCLQGENTAAALVHSFIKFSLSLWRNTGGGAGCDSSEVARGTQGS
jgi:hypothetical protein